MKKHYCPECNRLLEVDYKESVVDSRSEEASGYDFSLGFANRLAGNISFTVPYFHCANCRADYSVNDIKEAEHKVDSTCNADRSKKTIAYKGNQHSCFCDNCDSVFCLDVYEKID